MISKLVSLDQFECFRYYLALEWHLTCEKLVSYHSDCPFIDLGSPITFE